MKQSLCNRIICWVLACLMVLCLTSCRSASEGESSSKESKAEFSYSEDAGTLTLTSYTGNEEILSIPSKIDGKAVTRIGDACFQGNAALKKVTVPEGILSIGDYAFECCSRLEKIYLPDSLSSIGEGAFSGCGKMFRSRTSFAKPLLLLSVPSSINLKDRRIL